MECPGCKKQITYSWGMYFKNPFGRFVCPDCSAKFKFKRGWQYWLWQVAWGTLYLCGLVPLLYFSFSGTLTFIIYITLFSLLMIGAYMPIDRALEKKLSCIPR